jgi:hypothetical protein
MNNNIEVFCILFSVFKNTISIYTHKAGNLNLFIYLPLPFGISGIIMILSILLCKAGEIFFFDLIQ